MANAGELKIEKKQLFLPLGGFVFPAFFCG